MALKQFKYKIKGMSQDQDVSIHNPELSFENKNIRITARNNNTLLGIENEQGTTKYTLSGTFTGTCLGHAIIQDTLILFIKSTNDIILKIKNLNTTAKTATSIKIYEGNLNFNVNNKIETIVSYETQNIQKVYWTDGLNQPRVINVATDTVYPSSTVFDFVQTMELTESFQIEKVPSSNGVFAPGVIQYALAYYNIHGQHSNISKVSPLFYITHTDRGGAGDELINTAFQITLNNLDDSFQYARIYSISRTSIDATPVIKKIADIATSVPSPYVFIDTNTQGEIIDPTSLLYVGGVPVIVQAIAQKDNTLFLGNIELQNKAAGIIPVDISTVKETLRNFDINFEEKFLYAEDADGEYYKNALNTLNKDSRQSKTFKYNEKYRFGVQFQHKTGVWSEALWIKDAISNQAPNMIQSTQLDNPMSQVFGTSPPSGTFDAGTDVDIFSLDPQPGIGSVHKVIKLIDYPGDGISNTTQGFFKFTAPYTNYYNIIIQMEIIPNLQGSQTITAINTLFTHNLSTTVYPSLVIEQDERDYSSNLVFKFKGTVYLEQNEELLFKPRIIALNDSLDGGIKINSIIGGGNPVNATYIYVQASIEDIVPNIFGSKAKVIINNNTLLQTLLNNDYVAARGLVVYPELHERAVLAQGVVNPTVYNAEDRYNGSTFSQASWFFRPMDYFGRKDSIGNAGESDVINRFVVDKGARLEFKHDYQIPQNLFTNSELQCISTNLGKPNHSPLTLSEWRNLYYIDENIVTLNSPDIEFNDQTFGIDTSGLKFRIIGAIAITGNQSDMALTLSSTLQDSEYSGFIRPSIGLNLNYDTIFGASILGPSYSFIDKYYNTSLVKKAIMYPWHTTGSILKGVNEDYDILKTNKISNLRFGGYNYYFNTAGTINMEGNTKIFSNQEIIKLDIPNNSEYTNLIYKANIDKIQAASSDGYRLTHEDDGSFPRTFDLDTPTINYFNITPIKYKSTPHAVINFDFAPQEIDRYRPTILPTTAFYAQEAGYRPFWSQSQLLYQPSQYLIPNFQNTVKFLTDVVQLPVAYAIPDTDPVQWYNPLQPIGPGFLWIGELYKEHSAILNKFGGDSDEALLNNQWLVAGDSVTLNPTSITLEYTEGDTFIQRYDCLKTYSDDPEATNSITEILSFLVETRINLDTRYDRNRGQRNNLVANPNNYNLINPVYQQENNYFNYRALDYNLFNVDKFINTFTITKTKQNGGLIDNWTNITMSATYDADGQLGQIRGLKSFNDQIIGFQDRGVFQVLFNSRVQLPTSDGVPIELANSGKVDGVRYLSNTIGTKNKWSIKDSPFGLYFIDHETDSIMLFSGQFDNLSDKLGFRTWMNSQNTSSITTHYDKINKDVYFVTDNTALVYSELLQQFMSFYDYEKISNMFNINNEFYSIKGQFTGEVLDNSINLWEHNTGEYGKFFNKTSPFYITYVMNPEPDKDKVFTNFELKGDVYDYSDTPPRQVDAPLTKVTVWDEYQVGTSVLDSYNFRQKFRVWRGFIPRVASPDSFYNANSLIGQDRLRNTWAYLKLENSNVSNNRVIIHDTLITYMD